MHETTRTVFMAESKDGTLAVCPVNMEVGGISFVHCHASRNRHDPKLFHSSTKKRSSAYVLRNVTEYSSSNPN